MSLFFAQTVQRVRPTFPTDRYGNAVDPDWDNAEITDLPGVNIQPEPAGIGVGTDEGDRRAETSRWRLFSARGGDLDLEREDRVRYDGLELIQDGAVARYYLGAGLHHAEVRLKRVDG